MSHDAEAAWATTEVARCLKQSPSLFFKQPPTSTQLSIYAAKEAGRRWPIADGIIIVEGAVERKIAIEFKTENEGLHGILTALGQAMAYLHKGFSGSAIMVPKEYPNHQRPAEYIAEIVDLINMGPQIGVFAYDEPDIDATSPFMGKITCVHKLVLDDVQKGTVSPPKIRSRTQWAHLREGSSDPDAFFQYLKTAKSLDFSSPEKAQTVFPKELTDAANKLSRGKIEPIKFLSNSVGDNFHDRVWRKFWFECVLFDEAIPIWQKNSNKPYLVNELPSKIRLRDGTGLKKFFAGRKDSIKDKLVKLLNEGKISETNAWEGYAKNIRNRAHSYREDIDSGLAHLGLLELDGKPTGVGYKFVDACERNGDPNSGIPQLILGKAILQKGNLLTFLHYFFKISEREFAKNPWSFTTKSSRGTLYFQKIPYLQHIESIMANELQILRKVSLRGGKARRPFQAELAVLRNFGYVSNFRAGTGLVINWPKIQDVIDYQT